MPVTPPPPNHQIVGQHVAERPVWGIDGCTRRLLDLALDLSPLHTDAQKAHFVEKVGGARQ